MTKRLLLLQVLILPLIGLFATPISFAQGPVATLDRDSVFEGESVTLTIEVDVQLQNTSPDLTPLKKDFEILGQQSSTELRVTNSQQVASTRWHIELMPRRTGEIPIPPLKVGGGDTQALTLRVRAQPADDTSQDARDIYLEVEAVPKNPYVQAQVRYTIRLFYAVQLLDGNLEPPSSPDAVIEQLGKDASYVSIRHGRRYQVIERHYGVFPEKSGKVTLSGAVFQGAAAAANPRGRSLVDRFFDRGRRLRLMGDPVVLDVRPRPAAVQSDQWLPAESLELREIWPQDPPQFRLGEPVTRKLVLEAKGLAASQLPELDIPQLPGVRVYPDQPVAETVHDRSGVLGRLEQSMAIIPGEPGEFALPEIRVSWWDTRNDQLRVATLPERTIAVLGDASPQAEAPAEPAPEPAADLPVEASPAPVEVMAPTATPASPGPWLWISGALLGLWILTLFGWWLEHRARASRSKPVGQSPQLAEARRALRKACGDNDAQGAARALLDYAAAVWPENPPHNLGAVALRLRGDATPVRELDRALYAPDPVTWSGGEALWVCLKQGLQCNRQTTQTPEPTLPPLYPKRA